MLAKQRRTDPGALTRDIRGDLDWITLKALDAERNRRYETVHGLALDLGRYLRSEPVVARPPSAGYRISRFVRRHRVGTAIGAMLILMAAGFTVVLAVQSRRIALERDAATAAAARADALNEFLQRTLLSPDPLDGLGREVTMLQALDVAARRLRESPLQRPEADAAMRSAIGWAYFKLGEYDRARPLLLEALAIRERIAGPPLDHAESLLRAAALYDVLAVPDSAAPLYRKALGLRRQELGSNAVSVAEVLIRSGNFFSTQNDTAAARRSLSEALDIFTRAGDERGITLAENHIGLFEYSVGNLSAAEGRLRSSLRAREKLYGNHPLVAETMVNLGGVLEDLGRPAEAESLYRQGLAVSEKTLGADHDQVSATLNNLALLVGRSGRVSEGEALYRRAIAMDLKKLGADHPAVGIGYFNLADLTCRAGDPGTGIPSSRRALAILSKSLGDTSWQAGMASVVLGRCLMRQGQFVEAERHLLRGRTALENGLGPTHRRVDSAKARLAELYALWPAGRK
jgi:tetratricopeptide (TPR) repeat protein